MFDLRPLDRVNLIGGVRVEDASMFVISQDPDSPTGELKNQDFLPSVNLILNLTDEINLRFAYTNTIARPTFRELAPYTSFDFAGDNLFRGSSLVQRTLIKNLDGRFELYPASGEVLAFSVFYKWLENPIERVIDPTFGGGSSTLNETVQNVPTGRTYGFEVELRKNLGFISPSLNGFNLSTNFTLVNSEVDISDLEMLIIQSVQADAEDTRPLLGQSPYIVNVDLSYNNPDWAFYTALSYNYFDDRLAKVTIGAAPDIYEKGYGSLNLVMGKDFGKNVSVKLTGRNLLDPFISEQATFKGIDYINYRYREGRTFGLSVKYQF
jgi:TonB-dependent receptor